MWVLLNPKTNWQSFELIQFPQVKTGDTESHDGAEESVSVS